MGVVDKDKAQTNPSSSFARPADVVASKELSLDEKNKALREWELEARLLEVATEEGMNEKNEPSVLPEVKEAQRKLGVAPKKPVDSPTKF